MSEGNELERLLDDLISPLRVLLRVEKPSQGKYHFWPSTEIEEILIEFNYSFW